jgi:ER-bound oxygenase mpaB/B'/Rubber oxygenase, catalytic domain
VAPSPRFPSDFLYEKATRDPRVARARARAQRLLGVDLLPPPELADAFARDMYRGDPIAEEFVQDVFFGPLGARGGRELLDRAIAQGIDATPDAPESMRKLFREFETVPAWVEPELVERGAAVWRRWATDLFAVAGLGTLEMYTESAVAMPLSLTGGYAGDNAMRRFLETARFWIDVSEPHALTQRGTRGRATALRVRVMHVSVRKRVVTHPEWHEERWGLPISQAYMMLTLIGGSVAPALMLTLFGHITTPAEMRALLHFQRYLGHLLGVHPTRYPSGIVESMQLVLLTSLARSYTSGEHGRELIESFPKAIAERPAKTLRERLTNGYEAALYAGFLGVLMQPATRKKYAVPSAFPGTLLVLARAPFIAASELLGRLFPPLGRYQDRRSRERRERWLKKQLAGREAHFEAASAFRR